METRQGSPCFGLCALCVLARNLVLPLLLLSARSSTGSPSQLVQPDEWWHVQPRPGYASLEKVGVFQDWFEVYKLLEGTYAIYEPYQFEEVISYLVLGQERGVLVDSGNGIGDIRAVVQELTDLPVSVLLTHEHYDHVGGAYQFEEVAIRDHPAAVQRLQAGRANSEARRWVEGNYVWKPLPKGVDPETWSVQPAEPTRLLQDGEIIDLGNRTLEVIAAPGHSPGSACFLDPAYRLLFTGDHFYPGPLYAHAGDVDLDSYLASNDRLAARIAEYDHVLPGHNEPLVAAQVIPRVSQAFRTIFEGGGEFSEDEGLRRYRFGGFDILIRAESVRERQE